MNFVGPKRGTARRTDKYILIYRRLNNVIQFYADDQYLYHVAFKLLPSYTNDTDVAKANTGATFHFLNPRT